VVASPPAEQDAWSRICRWGRVEAGDDRRQKSLQFRWRAGGEHGGILVAQHADVSAWFAPTEEEIAIPSKQSVLGCPIEIGQTIIPEHRREYLHRVAFDIAEKYGKDTFLAIQILGTRWLPVLFGVKAWFDALNAQFSFLPRDLTDKIVQFGSRLFPKHLPKKMREYRDKYEHHLILKMAGPTIAEARDFLKSLFPSKDGDFFECTVSEGEKAFLHRFAAAGAAIRYRAVHRNEVEDIVALDVALRRNDLDWFEYLPADVSAPILHKLYYGHFFCHVFHQDYIIANGHNTLDIEHKMWALLDARGAQYPAEHNVGHLYVAKPSLVDHYRKLDPCNCFNPGIGKTSKFLRWGSAGNGDARLQCK
jgi:D-lactate dehydrogenase